MGENRHTHLEHGGKAYHPHSQQGYRNPTHQLRIGGFQALAPRGGAPHTVCEGRGARGAQRRRGRTVLLGQEGLQVGDPLHGPQRLFVQSDVRRSLCLCLALRQPVPGEHGRWRKTIGWGGSVTAFFWPELRNSSHSCPPLCAPPQKNNRNPNVIPQKKFSHGLQISGKQKNEKMPKRHLRLNSSSRCCRKSLQSR